MFYTAPHIHPTLAARVNDHQPLALTDGTGFIENVALTSPQYGMSHSPPHERRQHVAS